MEPKPDAPPPDLLERVAENDAAFSADAGSGMARFHAPHSRLMWPFQDDIVGRAAIGEAFQGFADTFETLAWEPDRRDVYLGDDRAVFVGRFVEVRRRRSDGRVEREHGRIVEAWHRDADDGEWYVERLLTSRYAENEVVEEGASEG